MNTAYRVWDGEQMYYGGDVNLNLLIKGKEWTYMRDALLGEGYIVKEDDGE